MPDAKLEDVFEKVTRPCSPTLYKKAAFMPHGTAPTATVPLTVAQQLGPGVPDAITVYTPAHKLFINEPVAPVLQV